MDRTQASGDFGGVSCLIKLHVDLLSDFPSSQVPARYIPSCHPRRPCYYTLVIPYHSSLLLRHCLGILIDIATPITAQILSIGGCIRDLIACYTTPAQNHVMYTSVCICLYHGPASATLQLQLQPQPPPPHSSKGH